MSFRLLRGCRGVLDGERAYSRPHRVPSMTIPLHSLVNSTVMVNPTNFGTEPPRHDLAIVWVLFLQSSAVVTLDYSEYRSSWFCRSHRRAEPLCHLVGRDKAKRTMQIQ